MESNDGEPAPTAFAFIAAESGKQRGFIFVQMSGDFIHDRGRGPEIVGTRITILDLLPYFLDPSADEAYICRVNGLTTDQVAAARAYVLHHAETVLAEHLEIEARIAAGNPPSVAEKAKKTHEAFLKFRHSLAARDSDRTGAADPLPSSAELAGLQAFRDWIAESEAHAGERP